MPVGVAEALDRELSDREKLDKVGRILPVSPFSFIEASQAIERIRKLVEP